MKCPKYNSADTKKVSIIDKNWHSGHQRCNSCNYQDNWGEFCDPPFRIKYEESKIILPGIDEE